jgi:hypothetical protein
MVARVGHIILANETVGRHMEARRAAIKALPYGIVDWLLRLLPIGRRQASPLHIFMSCAQQY